MLDLTKWKPLKGSQELAVTAPANHILFEGTRGNGKSEAQLVRFHARVGLGYGSHWRGVIFDRRYKELEDLIIKSKRLFGRYNDGGVFKSSKGDLKWEWPGGEELLFRVARNEDDYWQYHGQEFAYIGFNELTKYPMPDFYDSIMSCNRSSYMPVKKTDPDRIPLEVFSTTNPWGPGHNWVKSRFIDPAPPGRYVKITAKVFNPRTQKDEEITKYQLRLFGSYKENIFLTPEYILELDRITDPNKRAAWIEGSWDITSGGMFDDLWDSSIHIIDPIVIPRGWRIDRALDWGSSRPFSVGWFAESNGEQVEFESSKGGILLPRGSVVQVAEWYGFNGQPNKGIRMSAKDVAKGIKDREGKLFGNGRVVQGPADSAIFDTIDENSIASNMASEGVYWLPAYKGAGSRVNGWEHMRMMLESAKRGDQSPGLFFSRNCQQSIRVLPTVPRDEVDLDDVDTESEDHIPDMIRYRLYKKPRKASGGRIRM